jgi:hypothetical protein
MTQEPKETVDVTLREVEEPFSLTGTCFRAFLGDSPLYIGDETLDLVKKRVTDYLSHKVVNFIIED